MDDEEVTVQGDTRAADLDERERHNLKAPDYYLNRELTWLTFNRRVLAEARDERNALLERVKFLAISAGTLDEFAMKRIGGLKQQVGAGLHVLTVDGRTPQEQIEECELVVASIASEHNQLLVQLRKKLRKQDIHICAYTELDASDREFLREHYLKNIFPLVTPQAVDPAHPFPFISNLSLNLLVTVRYRGEDEISLARIKVPIGSGIKRFIRIGHEHRYISVEEVMANNLDLLFPGMKIESCELFRVTRNANTEQEEEQADDLLAMIESELRDRRFAPIVRLEVAEGMNPVRRGMLGAELGLDPDHDVIEVKGMLAIGDLAELARIDIPELRDPPHHPMEHPRLLDQRNIFNIIRDEQSILLMHPYQSFKSSVERFVREAAYDPKVLAIKCTIYRTSDDSRIIEHLIDAARNGKQVAVVVELKARFDEAANIRWANTLEQMGIHVTYGVVGLKTHCKCILVVRRDYDGLRRYAHIGTGNYHAGTARLYSDMGLLTCDEDIGSDLTELFNYLTTGYRPGRSYRKLLVAPKPLKRELLAKIEREIENHSDEEPGLIQFKTNALEDADITRALYKASQAGVVVTLLVRDTCRLRPGVAGLSENIEVVSVVGRFLEHARVYYFRNSGNEEYYIGSADCMARNLKSRVEVLVPIESPSLREELRYFIDAQLADTRGAWVMESDGSFARRDGAADKKARSSQQMMVDYAEKRLRQATRLRKRKPKGLSRRNLRR